jgi:predicted RNase H-related nuclease YkuK (DUF458 family)
MRGIKKMDTSQFLKAVKDYCEANGKDFSVFDGLGFIFYQNGDLFEGHFINYINLHYTIFNLDSDGGITHKDVDTKQGLQGILTILKDFLTLYDLNIRMTAKKMDKAQFLKAVKDYCEANGEDFSVFDGFDFRFYQYVDRFEGHFINHLGGYYTIFKIDSDDEMTHKDVEMRNVMACDAPEGTLKILKKVPTLYDLHMRMTAKKMDKEQFLKAVKDYCEANGKDFSVFDGFDFRFYQYGDLFEGHFINHLDGHCAIFKLDSDGGITHKDVEMKNMIVSETSQNI